MNRIDEFDTLRKEDWAGVYDDVPPVVYEGVQMAFDRIRVHERRRKQGLRLISIAACLCVALGVGAVALRSGPVDAPDRVLAPIVQKRILARDEIVFASKLDTCFHIKQDCEKAKGELVELQVMTAQEFEKSLCSTCGAGVGLP